jgi:hypothetical protein
MNELFIARKLRGNMDILSKKGIDEERMAGSIFNLRQIFLGISRWLNANLKITEDDLKNAGVYIGTEGAERSQTDPFRD